MAFLGVEVGGQGEIRQRVSVDGRSVSLDFIAVADLPIAKHDFSNYEQLLRSILSPNW